MALKITSTVQGDIGEIHKIPVGQDEVVIFQLPRKSGQLSSAYLDNARQIANEVLPNGSNAIIIGSDVDIFTICGEDALTLKLKGFL